MTPSSKKLTSRSKWTVICACFFGNFLSLGFAIGLGVLFVEILEVFETSRALASLIQSLCLGTMFTGSVFISPFLVRFKPGLCLAAGGLLTFFGTLWASFVNSVEELILTLGVITGLGYAFVHLASYLGAVDSLKENRGVGLAIITAGAGIGSCLYPQLVTALLEFYNWRGTLLILSALNFNACTLGLLVWQLSKPLYMASSNKDRVVKKPRFKFIHLNLLKRPRSKFTVPNLLKNGPLIIFLFFNLPFRCTITGHVVFLVDFGKSRGFELQPASFLVTATYIGYITGSFLAGIQNSVLRIPGLLLHSVSILLAGVIYLGYTFSNDYYVLMALCIGVGATIALVDSVNPLVIYNITEPNIYPVALSVFFGAVGVADIITGPVNGAIRDGTGSFTVMFYLFCAAAVVSGTGTLSLYIWTLKKKRRNKIVEISVDLNNTHM